MHYISTFVALWQWDWLIEAYLRHIMLNILANIASGDGLSHLGAKKCLNQYRITDVATNLYLI